MVHSALWNIKYPTFIFQNARAYHATSDIYPERDWLVDPYVATPPRNKLNNRSNGKEVLLKMEKTWFLETSEKQEGF